jgi:very-short-patch-repair endonuclease
VTFPELLLVVAACLACLYMVFRRNPKMGPRPKKARRPIPARSGHIKRKCVALRYRDPTPEQIAYMRQCQQQNLDQTRYAQPTLVLIEVLNDLGIRYSREHPTWYDGDRFVLSDFWLPDYKLSIEQAGAQHRFEQIRDAEKARIIFDQTGFRTARFWNKWFLAPGLRERIIALLKA